MSDKSDFMREKKKRKMEGENLELPGGGFKNKREKIGLFWLMHFGSVNPEDAKCSQCEDFKAGECEGGLVPAECMAKQKSVGFKTFGSGLPIPKEVLRELGEAVLECAKYRLSG